MAHKMLLHDAGEEKVPIILMSGRDDLPEVVGRRSCSRAALGLRRVLGRVPPRVEALRSEPPSDPRTATAVASFSCEQIPGGADNPCVTREARMKTKNRIDIIGFVGQDPETCVVANGTLRRRRGQHGPFLACGRYPDCRYTAEDAPAGKRRRRRRTSRGADSAGSPRTPASGGRT
jgi:hypothetical protein